MELDTRRYPIGIQHFEQLRNRGCVYVDKTELIYRLTHTDQIYLLSRPRRFGKSLLLSTLEAYFQGKKELFKGLAMEHLEQEWTAYPVLHIDFSISKYLTADYLRAAINWHLEQWEEEYSCPASDTFFSVRLSNIVKRAYQKTGKQVVLLVDEYDSPMLDSNSDPALQSELRGIMRDFFSPIKGLGQYLRFLFLTGISKFSQLSILSVLNNLKNISMRDDFSALCGITEEELLTQLKPDIEQMAEANGETYEEACAHLKHQYDGYHFSSGSPDIYNPFSLFNAFNSEVRHLDGLTATDEQFDAPTDQIIDPIPVLYQSGYLTIKGYDPTFRVYNLAYPNSEVRYGFTESLLPMYVHRFPRENTFYVVSFLRDLMKGDIESCLERTRAFFASIPHDLENKTEKHYQTIFYLLFRLMGQYVDVEVKSAIGRADVVLKLQDAIYVFEFKYDGTPEEALAQIDSKQYAIPYQVDNRKVVKVGINFDSATRTIGEWKISRP